MKRLSSIFSLIFLILFVVVLSGASAQAADRVRIGMVGFDSKAAGVSYEQASIISDLFTRFLATSKSISIMEREQIKSIGEELKFNMSGLVDMETAAEIGRIKGLQYMILGSVTELSEKADSIVIPIGGFALGGGEHEARATIDIRIVSVETSEIVLALSESGTSKNSTTIVGFGGIAGGSTQFGGIQARAIEDAVNKLAYEVRTVIGGESSYVIAMSTDGVTIDIGSSLGAKAGNLYLVYADGKSVLGMNDEIIGREKIPLAVVKVKEVSSAHSTCTIAPPSKPQMIKRGDKIEPISPQEAKGMKFATTRPAASSGTFEQIFGGGAEAGDFDDTQSAPVENDMNNMTVQASDEEEDTGAMTAKSLPTPGVSAKPAARREIPGFDPDNSTDSKVIQTYGLDMGAENALGIRHRTAYNLYRSKKYKDAYEEFIAMANEYSGNYLAAYWAGATANMLKKKDESLEWMEKALAINPNYKPAADFKSKTLKK